MKPLTPYLLTVVLTLLVMPDDLLSQKIFIDPGHGYSASGGNPDGRTQTEIHTNLAVGLKLRGLIDNNCTWSTQMSRTTNVGGWITLSSRQSQSDSWGADYFLSIHCNAGGGTGTETFWCNDSNTPNSTRNINFAVEVQDKMSTYGQWADRRVVEDRSYLPYHLGQLTGNQAYSCLTEIGFVDTNDANKLLSNAWRDIFADAYLKAFEVHVGGTCSGTACPPNLTLTGPMNGTYTAGNLITTNGQVQNGINCLLDAKNVVDMEIGFDAVPGSSFEAKIDGCP